MRIYIATKFEEAPRAIEVATQLKQAGHTITWPWWANDQFTAEQASKDFVGVYSADALVLIVEKDLAYKGAWVELGIAIGRDLPIYVMGTAMDDQCIFLKLPGLYRGIETLL
jgi:hypothetical protein